MLKKNMVVLAALLCLSSAGTLATHLYRCKEEFKNRDSISIQISRIPAEDRQLLERFLRFVIFHSSFGYVLFGDKPMAFEDFIESDEISRQYLQSYGSLEQSVESHIFLKGIALIEKYQHLFSSKKYSFFVKRAAKTGDPTTVFLINKKALRSIIEKHWDDFAHVLGKELHVQDIVGCLNASDCDLGNRLRHHSALLGTLLGYGRDNAWLYSRWITTERRRGKHKSNARITLCAFSKPPHPHLDLPVVFPGFGCNPASGETQNLREKYKRARWKIYEEYRNGDILEVTLKQFAESDND